MLLSVIFALVIVGVVLYLLTLIPKDPTVAQIIRVLVVVAVILWILRVFFPEIRATL